MEDFLVCPFQSEVQPPGIEGIGLVDHPRHALRLAGVDQLGDAPSGFNSSTIQYQFPTVSTATGEPRSQRQRKRRRAPRSCEMRASRTSPASDRSTDASV